MSFIDVGRFNADMDEWMKRATVAQAAGGDTKSWADGSPVVEPSESPSGNGEYIPNENEGQPTKPADQLTILTFDEIDTIPIDDGDAILGDHILDKGGHLVIAGQGGTGKSRLIFQFIAACKAGHSDFLGLQIHPGARDMRWLILQTENSVRRLKTERHRLRQWLGNEEQWQKFNNEVFTLAPVKEQDTLLNLDDESNRARIAAVIDHFKPDGIVCDPLGDYSTGDLNKDVDMRSTIMALSRLCRRGNPKRALILLHHALTGTAGAAKAFGYDRASFARNSKVLFNWARAQINVAPMNESNNETLAVTCGKCSDGKEFEAFGVVLNTESLIYSVDTSLDVEEWSSQISGKKNTPEIDSKSVQMMTSPAMSKPDLAKSIMQEIGCSKMSAYRYIKTAIKEGFLKDSGGRLFKA